MSLGVEYELNIGVGEGVTDASNRLVLETVLGYAREKDDPPRLSYRR